MKATLFLAGAVVASIMLTDARAQTDTSRNRKSKTDSTLRSQRNQRDSNWNRQDTLGRRDTGWQQNRRRDSVGKDRALHNREANANPGETSVAVATADWPDASRRAAEEMREKYGEPDIANDELVAWKDKGNWEMIIVKRDEKQGQLSQEELERLARSDRPGREDKE